MRKDFLVFGQPLIEQDEIDEFLDSVRSCWLGTGKKVGMFEQDFATYKNVKYAAAVSSCSAALHLSCLALNIKPGDEIITISMRADSMKEFYLLFKHFIKTKIFS